MNWLTGSAGYPHILLRRCHPSHQKSKHIQVILLMPFRRELVQRDQRRSLQKAGRVPAQLRHLVGPGDQVADNIAAMPTQYELVMLRLAEGCPLPHLERHGLR